jgi:hypothetical protein
MQPAGPVERDPVDWARARLIDWVVSGRGKSRADEQLIGTDVQEPVLIGFVARDHWVSVSARVVARVLRGGGVAAPDVAARGASAQMEPPAAVTFAFDTSGARRPDIGIDIPLRLFVDHSR